MLQSRQQEELERLQACIGWHTTGTMASNTEVQEIIERQTQCISWYTQGYFSFEPNEEQDALETLVKPWYVEVWRHSTKDSEQGKDDLARMHKDAKSSTGGGAKAKEE